MDSDKKINEETLELNDTVDLMDLTVVSRVFHSAKAFFSEAHETFSKVDHILGYRVSFNK
jgi:hypothetical protein